MLVVFAAGMTALAGGYWDDAWHTERGRDAFLIAPHIAIYAGIAAAGASLVLWALLTARAHGAATMWGHKPLVLGLLSVGVTLASGPIDNAWHAAFGRDAVIWSPPHLLGIAGTLALGAAVLAELAGRPERWARALTPVAGALVLASAGFTTAEYDTDVPQFDVMFYLPVLGLAAGIGLTLVRIAADQRWAATVTALLHLAFVAGVGGLLRLVDFPPPALPLLILPALVVDLAYARRWPPALTAALYASALHIAYVPVRNVLGDGVRFEAGDVAAGLALTWAGAFLIFRLTAERGDAGPPARRAPLAGAGVAGLLLLLALAPAAFAHDPGQGVDAGTVALRVTVDRDRAALTAELPAEACTSTEPRGLVARRGGMTLRAPLAKRGCRLQGGLVLPERGRWFIYAQMLRDGRPVESWLPVDAGSGRRTVSDDARYAYFPPRASSSEIKVISGVLLYGAMLALLYATLRLVQTSRRQREAASIAE